MKEFLFHFPVSWKIVLQINGTKFVAFYYFCISE
jgi:hypothetical protein